MRSKASCCFVVVLALAGCSNSHIDDGDTGGNGMDTGTTGRDSGAAPDGNAATDGGGNAPDASDAMLAATDAYFTPHDSSTDAGLPFGCNAMSGIDCDGDHVGMCTPACSADQCCSPQRSHFMCMPRNADGTCPLADLFVDGSHFDTSTGGYGYTLAYVSFAPGACEIMEGCVDGPGTRRLLRWDTWTPNQGQADMYLGATPPRGTSAGPFQWSSCHMHHHFTSYANYELVRGDGTQAATGHKQAFCLEDYYQYPCGGTGQPACRYPDPAAQYDCGNQGIEMGWQDVYAHNLPCQWIDVTDVPAGDYRLHISLNTLHILPESNYDNNDLFVSVSIADPVDVDVTQACATRTTGLDRDCGWTRGSGTGVGTCTPGASVTLGCSAGCGLGTCTGDTVLRVCDGAHDPTCTARWAIASNDDSTCPGTQRCGTTGDCCSETTFTCPASGTYAAFWAPFTGGQAATCNLAAR